MSSSKRTNSIEATTAATAAAAAVCNMFQGGFVYLEAWAGVISVLLPHQV
jgi:hypothetical protein